MVLVVDLAFQRRYYLKYLQSLLQIPLLGGEHKAVLPTTIKLSLISCRFSEILAKLGVFLKELVPLP